MTSFQRSYVKTLHTHFPNYHANFPPNSPVSLGDYGILQDGIFNRLGSGEGLGVRPVAVASGSSGTLHFTSGKDVSIFFDTAARAKVPGSDAAAHARIQFGRADAVFFVAAGCQVLEFKDEKSARDRVLEAFFIREWEPEWVLVTRIVTSNAVSVLVSESAGAFAELDGAASGTVNFADLEMGAKLAVKSSESIGLQFVAPQKTTPFVSLLGLKRRLIGPPITIRRSGPPRPERLDVDRDRMLEAGVDLRTRFETAEVTGADAFG